MTFAISTASLRKRLSDVDVLSLDVFDTILTRRCIEPTDVFRMIGQRLGEPGYADARVAAEAEARRVNRKGRRQETSLGEITGLMAGARSAAELQRSELDAEAAVLYVVPEIAWLIGEARALGKRVIAITDMYLSAAEVSDLLTANGVHLDTVYASSDFREQDVGKYNGRIFARVAEAEGVAPGRILHVGDNPIADVANATKAGLQALHVERPEDRVARRVSHFGQLRAEKTGATTGLVLGAIVRRELQEQGTGRANARQYGYHFGGPLVMGFLKHILSRSRAAGISRLVLLARDGVVVGRALDILRPERLSWRLIPASRRMAVFPLYASGGWPAIRTLFQGYPDAMTPAEVVEVLGLGDRVSITGLPDEPRPVEEIVETLCEKLAKAAGEEEAAVRDLLAPEIEAARAGETFAWVDVGWALTTPAALNGILAKPAPGFFVGSRKGADATPGFSGYLFEQGAPVAVGNALMLAVELIELLFTDARAATICVMPGPNGVEVREAAKSGPERLRDAFVADMQEGILAFVRDMADVFDDLDSEELRDYNRRVFYKLSRAPTEDLHALLSQIPHDKMAGGSSWSQIGDHWRPPGRLYDTGRLQTELLSARMRPLRTLGDFLVFRTLSVLSRMGRPLPKRTAARFRRSAEKRDPRNNVT